MTWKCKPVLRRRYVNTSIWARDISVSRVFEKFTAYATYTDGQFVGIDSRVTNEYMSCLQIFCMRCTVAGKDSEQVNRSECFMLLKYPF